MYLSYGEVLIIFGTFILYNLLESAEHLFMIVFPLFLPNPEVFHDLLVLILNIRNMLRYFCQSCSHLSLSL